MKKIVVVTYGYPSEATPILLPFLKKTVDHWHASGIDVRVINPVVSNAYKNNLSDKQNGVVFPLYRDYAHLKVIPYLRKLQRKLSNESFLRAVEKELPKENDYILYAHFLNAGYIVAKISEKRSIPAYCAFGESTLWSIVNMDVKAVADMLKNITGFISVSRENTDLLISNGLATKDRIITLSNGIDHTQFYPQDKKNCREELGLPQDKIIGIFVGSFIERKGPLRVNEATKGIHNLKMIYIGAGEQIPEADNILHCGKVSHNDIPKYLSAADFFILPTQAEGCCNAILEAMACGLPIISSLGRFNDDILDDSMSIRVDPMDVSSIRTAVEQIVSNEGLRQGMSQKAKEKSREFDIRRRTQKILKYMYADE